MSEALRQAQKFITLVRDRHGETLQDLRSNLVQLTLQVSLLPLEVDWPEDCERPDIRPLAEATVKHWTEIGFYDSESGAPFDELNVPESVGCAADDLIDICRDLIYALHLSEIQQTYGHNWLRWSYDTHWGEHAHGLRRYLDGLIAKQVRE